MANANESGVSVMTSRESRSDSPREERPHHSSTHGPLSPKVRAGASVEAASRVRGHRAAKGAWPVERRPLDAVRFLLGSAAVVLTAVAAHLARPTAVEINTFRLINQLPSALNAPLLGVMQLGAVGAVPVVAAVAVVSGRYRLGTVLLGVGTAAWGAAKAVQWIVDEEPPTVRVPRVLVHGGAAHAPGLAFPASHVAVAAAVTVVAVPYVAPWVRRAGWLLVGLIATARIYVGLHLPVDVIGGLALGMAVGALGSLVAGVPPSGASFEDLRRLFGEEGLEPLGVEPTEEPGEVRVDLVGGGRVRVRTILWSRPDQGWLSRLWRLVAYHELYTPPPSAPSQLAEHEAFLSLLLERAGVQ
ncbi:MAG: phosphatase PAP2 family protein, partial [Acidimicrobiales bacterium]